MVDLLNLEKQKISRNLRGKYIMLYSDPKAGKTSLAAQFENVLIAAFEMGTNGLDDVYVQPIQTWSDWKATIKQLLTKEELKKKYYTIAIDTVDEAWRLCVKYICGQNQVTDLIEIPWGRGYEMATQEFLNSFRDLTYAGYGLIFISHSTEKTMRDERGEEYTRIVPALPTRPYAIVNKMVDIIAYLREIQVKVGEKTQSKRYVFFRNENNRGFLAGSRYRYIVPRIELSYENFIQAIYDAIDAEASSHGSQPTDEENPFAKRTFEEWYEEARTIWARAISEDHREDAEKILEKVFGKPTKFSEVTSEQEDQLIQAINEIKSIL